MTRRAAEVLQVIPSARRLVHSLRDVGYDFVTAVADLVDNSIAAGATHVSIEFVFAGPDSALIIEDNGAGMTGAVITEAMRFGSQRNYEQEDLGKFGLGLKTASLSQSRRLTVASRTSAARRLVEVRVLDLDHIESTDRWEVLRVPAVDQPPMVARALTSGPGTVVIWEQLDRLLTYQDPWGERANRKLRGLAEELDQHLGMVFHRFLAPPGSRGRYLAMFINGTRVEPWDPFVQDEPHTERLPDREFELAAGNGVGLVRFRPFVLPPQQRFSSPTAWQRASGPRQWNRQQGFYIYRGDRLIQAGGWSWMRSPDEHTKLARAAVEFWPEMDGVFEVNVAKVRVKLPDDLKNVLRQPVQDLTRRANTVYRQAEPRAAGPSAGRGAAKNGKGAGVPPTESGGASTKEQPAPPPAQPSPAGRGSGGNASATVETPISADQDDAPAGGTGPASAPATAAAPSANVMSAEMREALEAAARAVGEETALRRITERLRTDRPEVACDLGWS